MSVAFDSQHHHLQADQFDTRIRVEPLARPFEMINIHMDGEKERDHNNKTKTKKIIVHDSIATANGINW